MNPALSLASIVLLVLLTACDRSTTGSNAPELASQEMTDAVGRVVRIPATPRRILALSELDLDALLALGLRPVGATNARGSDSPPAYLGTRAAGIESLGNVAQPSLDRIAVLQPDLILAGGQADPERLAQLEAIAPTVVSFTPGEFWQDSFRRIAEAVARPDEAQRVLDEYRKRAAALREKLAAHAGESVSIVRLTPNGPMFMLGDAFAGRVLADLSLVRPPAQRAPGRVTDLRSAVKGWPISTATGCSSATTRPIRMAWLRCAGSLLSPDCGRHSVAMCAKSMRRCGP